MNKRTQRQITWWLITIYAALVVGMLLAFARNASAHELIYMPSIVHIGGSYGAQYYGDGQAGHEEPLRNHYTLNDQPHLLAYRNRGFLVGVYKNSYHQGTAVVGWGWGPDLPGRFQPRLSGVALYGYSECWVTANYTHCADLQKPWLLTLWKPSNPLEPSVLGTLVLELKIRLDHGYHLNPLVLGNGAGLAVSYEF